MPESPLNLAKRLQFENIKWTELTESDILDSDKDGFTFLHYVSYSGCFDKLPAHLQDKKYWRPSKNNTTILMSAFERGLFEGETSKIWIKPEDLTEKEIVKTNGNGDSVLIHTILSRKLSMIPKTSLTAAVLKTPYYHDKIIHIIIRNHQLNEVPKEVLTDEVLSQIDGSGETAYHKIAAEVADKTKQDYTPYKHIWNQKTLSLENKNGVTPMHILVHYSPWNIPTELITRENLQLKDHHNRTVLHCWAKGKNWQSIPLGTVSENDLFQEEKTIGPRLIDNILSQYKDVIAWGPKTGPEAIKATNFIKKLITKLSLPSLQDVQKFEINHLNKLITRELFKRALIKTQESSIEI